MKILVLGRYALGVCASITFAACSSGGSQLAPSAASGQSAASHQAAAASIYLAKTSADSAFEVHPSRKQSWMTADAAGNDLLYISSDFSDSIYVYSYPKRQLVGTLTGFTTPGGLCADKTGNVWITNGTSILEYAHGGASPIATLKDPGYFVSGCSVDPTTGNLAVTNFENRKRTGRGSVAIYTNGRGNPTNYVDTNIFYYYYCGYDNKGNLYVDGTLSGGKFVFAELPKGSSTFTDVALLETIESPGGVQWDGKYVVIGDRDEPYIYQYTISGSTGREIGSTPLIAGITQFWIQGRKVVGPNPEGGVGIWNYPTGGNYQKLHYEVPGSGSTISLAK